MANGNLTIQQVYDDLQRQLQNGYTATLSQANLPSTDLWTLVHDTLATTAITVMPSGGGAVVLGPISGDSLTLSGSVNLLQFLSTTTITVTVTANAPNMAFTIQPPARNWTFGQSFWQLNVRDFNNLSTQINGAVFDWASAGRTKANALVFRSSVSMTGFYGVIQSIFAGSNTAIQWSGPIAFDDNGPNLNLQASLGTSSADISQIVYLDAPFFQARLTYMPSDDDPATLLPTANVALGMQLDTISQVVNDFKFYALFGDGNPTLFITGKYDDPSEVMTLSDVVQALMQNTEPPTLPAVLQPFFNAVGLQTFSCGFSTSAIPVLIFCDVVVSTNGAPNVWDIYSSGGETKIALQEMHLDYAIFMSSVTYYETQIGGTLRIFDIIFSADLTFNSEGMITAEANLTTVDGLPLRFSDMVRGLGCDLVAAGLDNFFDLGFSELGARLVYSSGNDLAYSVYANADISLKFFGKELLALHNTYIQFDATPVNQVMQYRVFASGLLYFLGANLPVSVILSDDVKRFTAGPVSFTLGDIITALVKLIHPSWDYELPAPWNVLNAIGFQNLTLSFDLNTNTIALDTGLQVDFGWISITRLALEYHQRTPEGQREGVILSLQGAFLGLEITTDDPGDDDSLSWDLVNGKPPAAPGAGEQLFKLEYLGLGQHVTFRNTRQLKTIGDVITALETNFLPSNDTSDPLAQMNDLVFNENSGWLIGAKFTVLGTVTLSAIFNDPVMYGLRIALAGETAGALAGLEFEILYKRITDTIGLYHIDLMLPDAIRQLEFGEVSIQIPELILDIYTNGIFKLDVGFPHDGNFDHSVGIEVFPFVGFGGFYFGYLNGDTSDRAPAIDNGQFDPVLEFGIGLAVGVGKTIEKGMLRAGATLTVEGILEGVLAWFHPDDSNRPKALYYDVQGAIGIDGHVYGAIDFAIVKASVDIRATAIVTLEIAAYQPIHIELKVDVSAKVKVKVLFVTIKLSFELELDLEWTVGHASPTPWQVSEGAAEARPRLVSGKRNLVGQRHPAKHPKTAPAARRRAARGMAAASAPLLNFAVSARAEAAETFTDIALTFAPLFSQSNQDALANGGVTASYAQRVRSIPMLVTTNTDPAGDAIFQQIVNLMFTRVVNARLQEKPPEQQSSVSLFDLTVIHNQLAAGLHDSQFSYDALTAYFTANDIRFVITPGLGSLAADTVLHGALFPMIPALTLTDRQTDLDGGNPIDYVSVNYATDPRFMIDETYEDMVNAYFKTFQAQSETALETGSQPQYPAAERGGASTETTAQFIFRDYFLMITRAVVDTAIQYMDAYPYATGAAAENLQAIATAMSTSNDVYDENPTALTIAIANQSTNGILQTGASTLTGVLYQVNHGNSLQAIATAFGITPDQLVDYTDPATGVSNGAEPNSVVPGVRISLGDITYTTTQLGEIVQSIAIFFGVTVSAIENDPGNSGLNFADPLPPRTAVQVPGASYTLVFGDTLALVASRYQTTTAVLAQNNQDNTALPTPLSVWSIPPFTHTITADDTLLSISQQYALSMDQLLLAGYATAPIIAPATTITVPYRPEIEASALFAAMNAGAVTDPIAVSVSRFLMYGLRLPQISPLTFDTMFGLYNLTGQQLDVPAAILQQPYAYQYQQTLTCSPVQAWVAFDNDGTISGDAGTYAFSTDDFDLMNAFESPFTPAGLTLRQLPLMTYVPNRYALRQVLHWQSPDGLAPVTGSVSILPGEPNIWLFPDTLRNRLNSAAQRPGASETSSLAFDLAVARQEKPNQPPVYSAVDNFAWGTLIDLQIKTVKVNAGAEDTVANDYLMLGADPNNRDLLYALWMYMTNEGASDTPNLYILFSSDPASQSSTGVSSDLLSPATTALLKSNLSTTTTQPILQRTLTAQDDPPPPPVYDAPLAAAADFIKLLWECSAVNTGGYYLNYRAGDDRGLPDNIFDQSGTAIIQLLVIFDSQKHVSGGGQTQPPMLTMSNCGILTDHLDLSNAQLVVKAAAYTAQQGQSLASVQTNMGFADMQAFVNVNQTIKLLFLVGYAFTANGTDLTVQAGDSLISLAVRANTTPLTVANALAAATDALIPGAVLAYASGQIALQGTGPVGSVGFEVTRANPDPLDLPVSQLTTPQQLNLMFNLLGYDLVANTLFQPKPMTLPDGSPAGVATEGFAIGPVQPQDVDEATRIDTWAYQKITPFYPFAVTANNAIPTIANLPASSGNPYAGIASGAEIGFAIAFQDVYGNRTDTTGAPGGITIPVGYRDNMRAFATWPGIAMGYWIRPSASQPPNDNPYKALAEIDIRFRVANYLAGSGQSNRQAQQHQRADQEKLTQIYYQYMQPDVQPIWTVTLDAAKTGEVILASDYFVSKSPAADALNAELLFLAQLLQTARQAVTVAASDNLDGLAARWLLNDAGAILEDNKELFVSLIFDLSGGGANDDKLYIPIILIDAAADTLTTLVNRAKTMPGVDPNLTVDQFATTNANVAVRAGASSQVPQRAIPAGGDPAIGDSTLLDIAAKYQCTVAKLAEDNADAANILRTDTIIGYQGLVYRIQSGDTFTSLAQNMVTIAVSANAAIQDAANSRGMSVGAFASANTSTPNLWEAGQNFSYEQQTVTVKAEDTLYTIANKFAEMNLPLTVATLAEANKDTPGLFAAASHAITGVFNVSVGAIALANEALPALFAASASLVSNQYVAMPGDTIQTIVTFVDGYSPNYTVSAFATANDKLADLFAAGTPLTAGNIYQAPENAETMAAYASRNQVSMAQVAQYNGTKPLKVGCILGIPDRTIVDRLSFCAAAVATGGSLTSMASLFGQGASAASLVETNLNMWRSMAPGVTITYTGVIPNVSTVTNGGDTFDTVWQRLQPGQPVDDAGLAAAIDAAQALRAGAVLQGPVALAVNASPPNALAAAWGVDASDLLTANRSLTGFIAASVAVAIVNGDGATLSFTTRANETLNTLFAHFLLEGLTLTFTQFSGQLLNVDGLIAAAARFVLPPALDNLSADINTALPAKIFRLVGRMDLARVNFLVTNQTIADLKTIPDVDPADADKLTAMANQATAYIDGDAFDAALRLAFGPVDQINYLIMLTRRFSHLPSSLIDPSFADVPTVYRATTTIPAHTNANATDTGLQTLQPFAEQLQAAYQNALKLGASAGPFNSESSQSARKLWCVDFTSGGYGYALEGSQPSFFAPVPIATSLQNKPRVPMRDYISGEPTLADAGTVDIKSANLDTWAAQFLQTMDLALSPAYATPIYELDATTYEALVAIKDGLADQIGADIANALATPIHGEDLAAARAAFTDRLKINLADAYRFESIIQFPVTITRGGDPASSAARLVGQPTNRPYVTQDPALPNQVPEMINTMAQRLNVSQTYLVGEISAMQGILDAGGDGIPPATVIYDPGGGPTQSQVLDSNDSLASLAHAFGLPSALELIGHVSMLEPNRGLFAPGLPINVTGVGYSPAAATTFEEVAIFFDISVPALGTAVQDVAGIFNPAVPTITYEGVTKPIPANATLGQMAAEFGVSAANLANYLRLEPDLVAAGVGLNTIEILPNYDLSTTKAALASGGSYMTFFLDLANQAQEQKVFMNLDFIVNQMEFDISAYPGDANYQRSSWLNFILPFDSTAGANGNPNLGQTEIPIVLEAYPDPPVLGNQDGAPSLITQPDPTLTQMKDWDYAYEFSYREAAQDRIYTGVTINDVHAGARGLSRALLASRPQARDQVSTPSDLLEALAQFDANLSDLMGDLVQLPYYTPGDANPAVTSAIAALLEFAAQILANWDKKPPGLNLGDSPGQDGAHDYKIIITRDRQETIYFDTMIFKTINAGEPLLPGKVEILLDGAWTEMPEDPTASSVSERVFLYPTAPSKVIASAAYAYRISMQNLDVIQYQSAGAGVQVKRNEQLISAGPTNPALIYTTPVVHTANMFTPLIVRDRPYLMDSGKSMVDALSDFFKDLFDIDTITWPAGATRLIKVHAAYGFDLLDNRLIPQAPAILRTQYAFNLATDYQPTPGAFVSNLAAVVNDWMDKNLDAAPSGSIVFDVIVFEAKTDLNPSPVLDLRTITYQLT